MRSYRLYFIILFIFMGLCFQFAHAHNKSALDYEINGITGEMKDNVITTLNSAKQNEIINQQGVDAILKTSNNLVKLALQPFGYFRPTVQTHLTELHANHWLLVLNVIKGSPLRIRNIDIRVSGPGKNNKHIKHVLNNLPIKVGTIFSTENYQITKQRLFNSAINHGYIKAKFTSHQAQINLKDYYANIVLHLATGEQYYFGPITIEPNFFSAKFIRSYAKFKPGAVFATHKLLQYQRTLNNSGYFDQVIVSPQIDKAKKRRVPVHIKVKPVKAQEWNLGGGFGTNTGVRGTLGWQWKRITSGGQHFTIDFNASERIGVNLNATYFIPGGDPNSELYTLTASLANYSTRAGETLSQTYSVNYLTSYASWKQRISLSFLNERFTPTGEISQRKFLTIPNITWIRLQTDNAAKPSYGTSLTIGIRGADRRALSQVSFGQIRVGFKWLQPITRNFRFFTRLTAGATIFDNFDDLPLSLRFTAGGATSVRGYPFQSLGPGAYLIDGSMELQQRVYKKWYLGAFYDFGNAFNNFQSPRLLKNSTGPAIIWDSPVGHLELSFARPLDKRRGVWIIQFSMNSLL